MHVVFQQVNILKQLKFHRVEYSMRFCATEPWPKRSALTGGFHTLTIIPGSQKSVASADLARNFDADCFKQLFAPVVFNTGSPVDIFLCTAALHLLYSSFRWGRWVIVGCYNGRRTKKVENHWFTPNHIVLVRCSSLVHIKYWLCCLVRWLPSEERPSQIFRHTGAWGNTITDDYCCWESTENVGVSQQRIVVLEG